MTIWKKPADVESVNRMSAPVAVGLLGIEFVEIGPDYIVATMPVDARTRQPFGLLHGGVSCVLAESMGSVGAWLSTDDGFNAVGTDINASHLRAVREGTVTGTARPIKLGRRMHVWGIEIRDEDERLVCTSRLTVAIVEATG